VFLLLLLASHLAFACSDGSRPRLFLWLTAMLAVVAFTVRPFGGAAIIGTAGALLLYDRELWRSAPEALARTARSIAPRWRIALPITFAIFAVAMLVTAIDDRMVWRIPECKCFSDLGSAFFLTYAVWHPAWELLCDARRHV
jgi:hypothetical protein